MKIDFIGTGYVGLVSGVMMAYLGHNVTCIDMDSNKIQSLKDGNIPIYEPGLKQYLEDALSKGKIKFEDNYENSIAFADAIFITVGTPPTPKGGANLEYVKDALRDVMKFAKSGAIIIIKSTVPPGTCASLHKLIQDQRPDLYIASNPEFLREGSAAFDFINPDRIVIGSSTKLVFDQMHKMYKPLTDRGVPIVDTDLTSSELIKYASNSFLATKIAFINEMADLCEVVGGNIADVSRGMGLDSRIGPKHLKPGPGFGGSCFPKDILALSSLCDSKKVRCRVLDSVIESNEARPATIVSKIESVLECKLEDAKIGVLGLAFKKNTDDARCSPAIEVIKILQERITNGIAQDALDTRRKELNMEATSGGAGKHISNNSIKAYDPKATANAAKILPNIQYKDTALDAITNVDIILIMTEWDEFSEIPFDKLVEKNQTPIIFDFRNMLNSAKLRAQGFKYYSVGNY